MTTCILTNNAALFPPAAPNTGRLIHTLTLATGGSCIVPPTSADFSHAFSELEREFNGILVLLASEALLPGVKVAQMAAQCQGGTAKISVLDSQQVGPGLGLLAQVGSQKAAAGASLLEVEEHIRAAIPHIFTMICPDAAHICQNGENLISTALTMELPGAVPVYSLEDGNLAPYKKIRTRRNLLESLQEFLEEFETPQQLAYFRGYTTSLRIRPLRQAAHSLFPSIPFSELELNAPLTALFGSQTVGMTILEVPA